MSRRIVTAVGVLVVTTIGLERARATNVGAGANMSAIQAGVTGDNLINFDMSATLTMDADGTDVQNITVQNGINAVIDFQATTNKIIFADAAGTINIMGNGTLTVMGTNAAAGFDFSTTAGVGGTPRTLTITSSSADSLGDAVAANRIMIGRGNTLTFAASGGAADALNVVDVTGTGAQPIINPATAAMTIQTLNLANNVNLSLGAGRTLTIQGALTVPVGRIVTMTGTDDVSTETLIVAGGMTLAGAAAELAITGDSTSTMAVNGSVNVTGDNAVLDVDANASISAVNMTSTTGDLNLQVAAGRTLTTFVDVNANTLTLSETGTVSTVTLDTAGGNILANAGGTITTLNHSASTVTLADGINLTVTNPINVGAATFVVAGSGGGAQDTFTATVNLNNAASVLQITGAAADNIKGMTINATAAGGTLDLDAGIEATAVNINENATIDATAGQVLTGPVTLTNKVLTLLGAGTVADVTATTGTITADGTTTIATLTANPGAGGTFTYGGTGDSIVTTLTPLDANGEGFVKTGTGSLTVTNGFDFAGATGISLNVNEGTFVDPATSTLTFGDDAEAITVASGATYTTSRSVTGDAGTNANLDAAATSTVNFAKSGTLTLTATADGDFKLLGTVNVLDGCTVDLAGAFATEFGDVNVKNSGSLTNTVPNASMLFSDGSTLKLEGTGSGTLTINGQAADTPVTVSTSSGSGSFTMDRGASTNMTIQNVDLSNSTYTSADGGSADAELKLIGVKDSGNNTNWFTELIADAGPDKTIISGNSTTLEGAAAGASGTFRFAWTPTTGLSDPAVAQPTASPTETTVYTLTVFDDVDVSRTATDTVTVTVNPPLAANAGEDKTVAPGGSVMLDGSATGGSGQYAFSWSPTDGLDDPTVATPIATPAATTTYTLTVTDTGDNNKTATDDVLVTVSLGGLDMCGVGMCGTGAVPLMPMMLLALFGWKWTLRRHRG